MTSQCCHSNSPSFFGLLPSFTLLSLDISPPPSPSLLLQSFTGHGSSINDIAVLPQQPTLFLTASKDESLRLWNLRSRTCVLIMSGDGGHKNEVLSLVSEGRGAGERWGKRLKGVKGERGSRGKVLEEEMAGRGPQE